MYLLEPAPTSMQRVREQKSKKLVTLAPLARLESRFRLRHAALGPVSTSRHRRQTSGTDCALAHAEASFSLMRLQAYFALDTIPALISGGG